MKKKKLMSWIFRISWIIPLIILILGINTIIEMINTGYTCFAIFLIVLFIWAVDIITPPYPSSELPLLLLGKKLGLKLWMSEVISQMLAIFVIIFTYVVFDGSIKSMIISGFNFVSTPLGVLVTVVFAGVFIYFAVKEK